MNQRKRVKKILNRPQKIKYNPDLPITHKKDEIIEAINDNKVVIISGETGSGKTTQIPKFCLEAKRGIKGVIGCTQPRRIAAINVAKRIAHELGENIGHSIGYKIRFDDKTKGNICIKMMTDGILLAETQSDRFLKAYDTIIVDEAHERSLNIDFTLGILRRLVKKRDNLKLIITSATIDTQKFSKAFDNAPIIEVSGRMFPVETQYMPFLNNDDQGQSIEDQGYVEAAADAVNVLLSKTRHGDILVFMPTEQDIGDTMEIVRGNNHPGVNILPLFARLSAREQSKIFSSGAGRKVIVATNVAETSLTIPGIKYVVDTGLARIPSYSPRTRTTALPVTPISQSSANQRMGRCGRVENGVCIRLFDEDEFMARPFFTSPEILRSNLAEVILRMISLNLGNVSSFPFIDKPAPKSIKDGFATLIEIGAIKKNKNSYLLTKTGRTMAKLPIDPKLSRILIEADKKGCLKQACVITTALAIADPRQRPADKAQAADQKHALYKDPASDFITLLNIWNAYKKVEKRLKSRSKLRKFCQDHFLSFKRLREWSEIHRQIIKMLRERGIKGNNQLPDQISIKNQSNIKNQISNKNQTGTKNQMSTKTQLNSKNDQIGTKGLKSKTFDIGGPLYIALHQCLLYGYLANIAHKKEKNIFNAAKGQQAMIFPGSGLFNNAGNWIVAAEFVKTSQLFARSVAKIDPSWLEKIGGNLCTRTYSEPHWEKKRGEVTVKEQVSLFGLVIVSNRKIAYGRINQEESGEIFIRHALVKGEIHQKFEFMTHNLQLIEELETFENKQRTKDILASEDDMYMFYQSKLPKSFFNIRSFSKFIKDQKSENFLKMSKQELQKLAIDDDASLMFPDTLEMEQGKFKLEYEFKPGSKKDGITINVPVDSAMGVSKHRVDMLVPGLFEDKIAALIKTLPKKYRVKLVPVSTNAKIIASEMPKQDKPLFSMLSSFILKRFNLVIPPTQWSDKDLPDHLKMRISIKDDKGKELKALRNNLILDEFAGKFAPKADNSFNKIKKEYERFNVETWDFNDLEEFITTPMITSVSSKNSQKDSQNEFLQRYYPGLKIEESNIKNSIIQQLSLRLFKSKQEAVNFHTQGVNLLFQKKFPEYFKALKKDINSNTGLKLAAPFFSGQTNFQHSLFNLITNTLFAKNIRTKKDFTKHGQEELKNLYNSGQKVIKTIIKLGKDYQICFELIQKLSLKFQNRQKTFTHISNIFKELKSLVPHNFLDIYTYDRISNLNRYISCIAIRAQSVADNPVKEEKKILQLGKYNRHLESLLSSLSQNSTKDKSKQIEDFFWLIEEYKISLFAPKIKTAVKISDKRLDKVLTRLSTMI